MGGRGIVVVNTGRVDINQYMVNTGFWKDLLVAILVLGRICSRNL